DRPRRAQSAGELHGHRSRRRLRRLRGRQHVDDLDLDRRLWNQPWPDRKSDHQQSERRVQPHRRAKRNEHFGNGALHAGLRLLLDLDGEFRHSRSLEHVEQVRDRAVRRVLVRADDRLHVLAGRLGLSHFRNQRVVVDGNAVEERLAFARHQQRERLLHGLAAVRRPRQLHLDGLLHDVAGGHHEDDQEHERDVHQRRDVDPGDPLVLVVRSGGRHHLLPFRRCSPDAMALPSALERPITRLSSRWKMLNASTAGMATNSPTAVATSASEMPAITNEAVLVPPPPLFATARSAKARMIPNTVPNRPMKGALFPKVPSTNSHFSYSSRRRSMVDCTAFSTANVPPSATPAAARTTSDSIESLVASVAAFLR